MKQRPKRQQKISMKVKAGFLEKRNKTQKASSSLRKEKTNIIRNERRDNTIDTIKMQRIIKNCCEHLCVQNLLAE